jgi:hypothetical protein
MMLMPPEPTFADKGPTLADKEPTLADKGGLQEGRPFFIL